MRMIFLVVCATSFYAPCQFGICECVSSQLACKIPKRTVITSQYSLQVCTCFWGVHGLVPAMCSLVFRESMHEGVQLVTSVFNGIAQRRFKGIAGFVWSGKVPHFSHRSIFLCLHVLGEAKTRQDRVAILAKRLEKFAIEKWDARLALGWVQAVVEIGVQIVECIDASRHGRICALACYLLCTIPSLPQLGLVGQCFDIMVREPWWPDANLQLYRASRGRTVKSLCLGSQSISYGRDTAHIVFSLI